MYTNNLLNRIKVNSLVKYISKPLSHSDKSVVLLHITTDSAPSNSPIHVAIQSTYHCRIPRMMQQTEWTDVKWSALEYNSQHTSVIEIAHLSLITVIIRVTKQGGDDIPLLLAIRGIFKKKKETIRKSTKRNNCDNLFITSSIYGVIKSEPVLLFTSGNSIREGLWWNAKCSLYTHRFFFPV